jgi:aldehyde:ferredoxin oxidoreductase
MPYGYNGKVLHVDLSKNTWDVETPSDQWYRTYMGGSAFASYYLLKMVKPGIDALSADNVLVFATSVVCGAPISGYNRYTVAAKSPLTGCFGESEAGGYFGPELKFAGFDAVVITGKAPQPVYLFIHNGEVEIRDAADIWGLDNHKTLEKLEDELADKKIRAATIGPAGERLVRFANVSNDMEHFNGRTGMGCVMGSKNLKAVVARGRSKPPLAEAKKVAEIARWHNQRIKSHPPNVGLSTMGTPGLVKGLNAGGILPTRNFKYGTFDQWENISWDAIEKNIFHSAGTCYMCSVKCKRRVKNNDDAYPLDERFGGPEYESIAALGSNLMIDNIKAIARATQLCNLYGMDTISAGNMAAFVMECYEAGIIDSEDLDGRTAQWGDDQLICWLVEQMGERRGIGDILAEGSVRAAQKIGKGAEQYVLTIKGNDLPLHDGRGKTGMAMGFALSSTGADHVETPHDVAFQGEGYNAMSAVGITEPVRPLDTDADKVRFFKVGQLSWGINNLLSICNFCSLPIHAMTYHNLVESVRGITGWDTSLFEILQASERSMVMSRQFNAREGMGAKDDRVIERWYEPMPEGPLAGKKIDRDEFEQAIKLYYQMMGWDHEGRPTPAKLVELSLGWAETVDA